MKNTQFKSIISLLWVVFTDSLGWGIAFSVFAVLFFNEQSTFLSSTMSNTSRYMVYEVLLAIYSIFMFFFAPVIGGISDHYGRKPGLNISMIGLTLGFVLSAVACYVSSLWLLIIGRSIAGITAGSSSVAQAAVVDLSDSKSKAFYLSLLSLSNCLGFSLGPVLGGLFVQSGNLPTGTVTFLIGAGISAVGLLGVMFFFKETYTPEAGSKLNLLRDFTNIKIAFAKPILKDYLLAFLFSMLAFGLFFSNIPVFLNREFATSNSATGVMLSVQALFFSISLLLGGKYIFNYFDKAKVVIITQVIQLIVYLLISLCIQSYTLNYVLFSCISFFIGPIYLGLLTLISDATDKDWQGRVMGVVASLQSLTWGLGPLLCGGVNNFGAGIASLTCAMFVLTGLVILLLIKKPCALSVAG